MYSKIPKTKVIKWGNGRDDVTWVLPAMAVHLSPANMNTLLTSERVTGNATRRFQERLAQRIR